MVYASDGGGGGQGLAVYTAGNEIVFFGPTDNLEQESDKAAVVVNGAGGNGFAVKCGVLRPTGCATVSGEFGRNLTNLTWMHPSGFLASSNVPGPELLIFELSGDQVKKGPLRIGGIFHYAS